MLGAVTRLSVAIGLMAVAVTAAAGSAQAHDGWKKKKRWHHHEYVVTRPVYLVERPVVYAPPRPVYVEPMYYGPPPAPSLNINIPLR